MHKKEKKEKIHYYVDGYNLLFHLYNRSTETSISLQKKRDYLLFFIQKQLLATNLFVIIVFDAASQERTTPSVTDIKTCEIIFTPQGQSADDFILEKISFSSKQTTVVTSDKKLALSCKEFGANILSIEEFLSFLSKKKNKKRESSYEIKQQEETSFHMERLQKIFEKRLKELDSDNQN